MSHLLKSYPIYKDSGIQWLGEVPIHWDTVRMKYLFKERVQKGFPNEPLLAATQTKGVVPKTHYENRTVEAQKDLHLLKLVKVGDYVISLRSFQGGIEYAHYRGIISPAYTVLAPSERVHRGYFEFLFKSFYFVNSLSLSVTGIREGQNIDYERLSRSCLPVPSIEEQQLIGQFLRYKLHNINRYISAKQRLIKLLNEQKQAIINRAVTRGLDPDVRLKPSGIEWIGEIPEHWNVSRLKHITSHIVDCLHATPEYIYDGTYPAIRTADIEPGLLLLNGARRIDEEHYQLWTSRLEPREGDILYSREGERYGIAVIVPADTKLCISQRMMLFRIRAPQSSQYIMWQLNCPHVYAQASSDIIGSTSPHVNVERIKNYMLILPPPYEQIEIATWLGGQLKQINETIYRTIQELNLIREYRTRLIADVVTGKLDVREVTLPALDEKEELAIIEEAEELTEINDSGEMEDIAGADE